MDDTPPSNLLPPRLLHNPIFNSFYYAIRHLSDPVRWVVAAFVNHIRFQRTDEATKSRTLGRTHPDLNTLETQLKLRVFLAILIGIPAFLLAGLGKSLEFLCSIWMKPLVVYASKRPVALPTQITVGSLNTIGLIEAACHLGSKPCKTAAKRLPRIAEYLIEKNLDILALEEVFDFDAQENMIAQLKEIYPYIVYHVGETGPMVLNSGLVLCSKFPIDAVRFSPYRLFVDMDKRCTKGVLMARLQLSTDERYRVAYVACTHLQAGNSREGTPTRAARTHQLNFLNEQFFDFQRELSVEGEQVMLSVVMGDFNVNQFDADDISEKNDMTIFREGFVDVGAVDPLSPLTARDNDVCSTVTDFKTKNDVLQDLEHTNGEKFHRIDYILLRNSCYELFEQIDFNTEPAMGPDGRNLTDHLLVWGQLVYRSPALPKSKPILTQRFFGRVSQIDGEQS